MKDDASLVSDSWRIDQDILRRNAAPADPAALSVDDLIRFLDEALRLAGDAPGPRPPAADYTRRLI
ncbi:MAG: hypothetical protein COV48_14115 [Elusimicrobia bacterium CG11_big_fil_rev_8_21_14_0_20_64_6]|nr:MAG: hypothetical protein COV48_14115 [Elusimicrobia bacterium CG11_big_fil_rev_8_21_14_0_20_64_6]